MQGTVNENVASIRRVCRRSDHPKMRVHNRVGGMGDLAYFEGGIWDASEKQEREAGFQIQAGAR